MPISPNVDFTAGQILNATQQNQFPRGVVAYTESSTTPSTVGNTETVILTGGSFTAVANRYYKVTYFEPQNYTATGSPALTTIRFRQTNLAGTTKQAFFRSMAGLNTQDNYIFGQYIGTLSAGTTNFVVTAQAPAATTVGFVRASTSLAFLLVEDLGPS